MSNHNYITASRTAWTRIAQRYGRDFVKVFSATVLQALPYPIPNEITASMFYGNGEDILAVAEMWVLGHR